MVHLILALYGEKRLVDAEIRKFQTHLEERRHGSVRELRFIEIVIKEEHELEFVESLKRPHFRIKKMLMPYLIEQRSIPSVILDSTNAEEPQYEIVDDNRMKDEPERSPHTIILARKEERKYPNGREIL